MWLEPGGGSFAPDLRPAEPLASRRWGAARRLNAILAACGFAIVPVALDQFTRCGGGAHCLTMPLARQG